MFPPQFPSAGGDDLAEPDPDRKTESVASARRPTSGGKDQFNGERNQMWPDVSMRVVAPVEAYCDTPLQKIMPILIVSSIR